MKEIKFLLNGLNCANCANKIETKIRKKVIDAHLIFVTKELIVKVENDVDEVTLFNTITEIVNSVEDGVVVCESVKVISVELILEGLNCANCAAKIEKALNNTLGIKSVAFNFVTKILSLEIIESLKGDINNIVQGIVDSIEDGVVVKETKVVLPTIDNNYSELIRLIVGTVLFGLILFLKKDAVIYLPAYIISYLLIGGDIVLRAAKNILKGRVFDENFLMTVATISAFAIGEYPEAVAVMLFYQVGEYLQDLAVNRSRRSIKRLMSIRPDVASLLTGDTNLVVSVEYVKVNDIIVVKPGERIPLDGIVVKGTSTLDTKALTGESLPLSVTMGEQVLSGCINQSGLLEIKVTKIASDSTVAKILSLVENASSKKAPTEKFITKFARVYTPIVTILALLIAVVPPLLLSGATFSDWLQRACVFLVISCPCALVISIPLGFFGGIGVASKNGILVKGGNYLEALNEIEIAVFDKTGTLTEGSFEVTKIKAIRINESALLEKAALVEGTSNHPIALSIVKKYGKEIDKVRVKDVKEIAGYGIIATIDSERVIVGNAKLMKQEGIDFTESEDLGSIIYIAINEKYAGYIVVADRVKQDAKATINRLKEIGIKKTVMLTGDKSEISENVARILGIDEVYSELLPQDKLNIVERLNKEKSKNGKLFFVGDGINDTPVLAMSDIGIAMGALGADAAIDVADMVIMTDEMSKIIAAVNIANKTRKIVWQNIYFALGVKLIFLFLGALGYASMWYAVFADVGVSLIAILNSMRILNYKVKGLI